MRLRWWEMFILIVFLGTFVLSVVIPWLSQKLVYDRLAFGAAFAVAVVLVAGWITFRFSRRYPHKGKGGSKTPPIKDSAGGDYQKIFPTESGSGWKRVIFMIGAIFILLLIFYLYKRGELSFLEQFFYILKEIIEQIY